MQPSSDDKECYSYTTNGGAANGRAHRKNPVSRAKPTPSKWDDAQKWLAGVSSGRADGVHGGGGGAARPRNSNADDRRLLGSASQNGRVSCSSLDGALEYNMVAAAAALPSSPPPPPLGDGGDDVGETKKIDCMVVLPHGHGHGSPPVAALAARPVCLRDMGTEMTPIASKEPSRTATPLRASTPVARSPISSRSSTPARRRHEGPAGVAAAAAAVVGPTAEQVAVRQVSCASEEGVAGGVDGRAANANSLESRAAAWDEAERAKFTARYKREEVKIQAWENHEKRKAEMEMKKIQMKAEQMKARAQEKLANRLAATRRMAEEKRASAEAKLSERAARTSEKANYIRRTGHLPSSFFKMPCLCG